jgi:hypothetical protein
LALKANSKPDISAKIVFDHTGTRFSLDLAELGTLETLACEIAVPLVENWSNHTTSEMMGLLTE